MSDIFTIANISGGERCASHSIVKVQYSLYQQIKTYLRQGILSGSLAADTRLPASRQLAQDLGVNRITVENAYAELEAEGLIFSRLGSGTYVLPPDPLSPLPKNDTGCSLAALAAKCTGAQESTIRSRLAKSC